jgi:hypothetical protein
MAPDLGRKRSVPLLLDFIKGEGDLEDGMGDELDENGRKTFMSLVGIIGYLATTIRFDVRFGYMILARKLAIPVTGTCFWVSGLWSI